MPCGCGGNSGAAAGAPLLSGVLTGQYAEDAGGLALSNPPSNQVAADVAASPGALFTSGGVGGFLAVLLFIGIAVVVVRGASKKSE